MKYCFNKITSLEVESLKFSEIELAEIEVLFNESTKIDITEVFATLKIEKLYWRFFTWNMVFLHV